MQRLEEIFRIPWLEFFTGFFRKFFSKKRCRISSSFLLFFFSLPFLLFLTLPIIAIVLKASHQSILKYLLDYKVSQTIILSFLTGTATMVLILIFGTPLSYFLARKNFFGKKILEILIDLPAVLPPTVAGLGLLMAFGRRGLLGSTFEFLGIEIAFTPVAVILAQAFVSSPYYIKSAVSGFSSVERELEQAAAVDGANPRQIFQHITLPLASYSIISGMVLSWARALGEFGATIIFAGNYAGKTQTMPLSVYLGFQTDLEEALTLAVILLVISFAILFSFRSLCSYRPFVWPCVRRESK